MTSPSGGTGFSAGQTLGAVAIAAIIAAFGGAAIYAATDTGSHTMGPGVQAPGPGGWGGPPRFSR